LFFNSFNSYRKIAEAYSTGIPMVEVIPEYKTCFLELFTKIKKLFFYQEA